MLPAAAALELVHSFSLVTTTCRRSTTTTSGATVPHVGAIRRRATQSSPADALLAEAFLQAAAYPTAEVAREPGRGDAGDRSAASTSTSTARCTTSRCFTALKTGRLFGLGRLRAWAAEVPVPEQLPWARVRRGRAPVPDRRRRHRRGRLTSLIHGAGELPPSRWTQRLARTAGWRRSTPTRRCSARSSPTCRAHGLAARTRRHVGSAAGVGSPTHVAPPTR